MTAPLSVPGPRFRLGEAVSLGLSVVAILATLYFWFVQSDRERPQLKTHLAGLHAEHFDGGSKPGHWKVSREVKFAIANNSTLPNAVMSFRVQVKARDGSWLGAEVKPLTQTELPANVSPSTVLVLSLRLTIEVPEGPERSTFSKAAAEPVELKVEVTDLGGKTFADVLAAKPALGTE